MHALHDREVAQFLKNLRGKHRRAMLLALSEADAKYSASCKKTEERYKEIKPILKAAYDKWLADVRTLTAEFLASIPEDVIKRMGYLNNPNHPDTPTSIMNFAEGYYRDDTTLRVSLYDEMIKLRNFLLAKQEDTEALTPKVTKQDTEARKLLTEFDASKALSAGADAPSPKPNPDGSLDAERIS